MAKKKIIILAVLALVFLGIIFIPGYLRIKRLARENRELESQMEQTRQANRKLQEEQEALINDPFYREKVRREKWGVVKKGEVVYKVLPPQETE